MKQLAIEQIKKINTLLETAPSTLFHGLYNGTLGLLHYYYHAGKALNDEALLEKAAEMLGHVFDDMNESDGGLVGAALSSGGAGLGFAANYLQQQGLIEFDTEEELSDLDDYLLEGAMQQLEEGNTDLLHGPSGILYYFANRQHSPAIRARIDALANALLAKAIFTDEGVWYSNSFWKQADSPTEINLSLSHGLCGILLALVAAYPALSDPAPAERVIREGIRFIMGHECPVDSSKENWSYFPGNYLEKEGRPTAPVERLAWCYGDLNEVLLLYRAGKLLGDESYIAAADRVGQATVSRTTLKSVFCEDTHFCHGTAGLAQFYKALYNEMPLAAYQTAYEHWIAQTLQLVDKCIAENKYEKNPTGLLEGWPGTAIVLAEYVADGPMHWAKVFAL
jgi:lantibiotic biosynthesis protein